MIDAAVVVAHIAAAGESAAAIIVRRQELCAVAWKLTRQETITPRSPSASRVRQWLVGIDSCDN